MESGVQMRQYLNTVPTKTRPRHIQPVYPSSDLVILLQGVCNVPAGVREFRRRHLVCCSSYSY